MKDSNGDTGRGRKTCRFYSELNTLVHRPTSVPPSVLDTAALATNEEGTNGNL